MSSTDAVTVDFDLTREEYLRAQLLAMSRQPLVLMLTALGVALVVGGVFTAPAYAGAGVVVLLSSFSPWWTATRRWRRDPAQAGPFTYQFDRSGIAIASPAGNVALPWERVRKLTIGKRLVVLQIIGGSGVMFPWRAVPTADRERLKIRLREHSLS